MSCLTKKESTQQVQRAVVRIQEAKKTNCVEDVKDKANKEDLN
jgi:hypothetical protein